MLSSSEDGNESSRREFLEVLTAVKMWSSGL
jgi:hypothetical protein